MGWAKNFDDSTPVVAIMKQKRDAVTMLGIPDRVGSSGDLITRERGSPQPKGTIRANLSYIDLLIITS
jgi:hypothetical protein